MRKVTIFIVVWALASAATLTVAGRDLTWATSHMSPSTLYSGKPPPILKLVDDTLMRGVLLADIGLCSSAVCVVVAFVDAKVQQRRNRKLPHGFEVLQ